MQCVQCTQHIVICNIVQLIVKKVTLQGVISMALCGSFSVHSFAQTNMNKFFLASCDFRNSDGLEFLRLGPGLATMFATATA